MIDDNQGSHQLQAATLEWIDRFAPYGVITTDRELRVRSWNHWMERHSGTEAKAVLGRRITELVPDLEERRLLGQIERALQGEVSVVATALHEYLIPLQHANREISFPLMQQTARIAPLVTQNQIHGVIIVIEDVTQREWQSEILRLQHEHDEILAWALAHLLKAEDPRLVTREVFRKIAEHLDFDTYILHLFEPETSLFKLHSCGGIVPEQETLIRSVPAREIPWLVDVKEGQALVREQVQTSTDPIMARARELGFHAYVVLPLVANANVLGILCFATRSRDKITEAEIDLFSTLGQYLSVSLNREKIDRELRAAQTALNKHAHELEQNVAERTASLKQIIAELQTFSYTIAHDLRAPIRAVKGYCEALIEDYADTLPPEGTAIIHRLRNSSMQMDALTRDLLEFSKVSRQDLALGPTDLSAVVGEIVSLGGVRLADSVRIEEPLHAVYGHRTLVAQCITNLLENALKFVKPEIKPNIRIWSELVPLNQESKKSEATHFSRSRYSLPETNGPIAPDSPRIRLWVEDNGIGISREARGKIFGIFERGDCAGKYDGTGIGLAIVARAMERMDGACGVESELGLGSRFWLEFQAAIEDLAAVQSDFMRS